MFALNFLVLLVVILAVIYVMLYSIIHYLSAEIEAIWKCITNERKV